MGAMAQSFTAQEATTKYSSNANSTKDNTVYYPSSFSSCASIDSAVYWTFPYETEQGNIDLPLTGSNPLFNNFAQLYPVTATVTGVAAVIIKATDGANVSSTVALYNADFSQQLAATTYNSSSIDTNSFALYQFNFTAPINASTFNVTLEMPLMTETNPVLLFGATSQNCTSNLTKSINYQGAWKLDSEIFQNGLPCDFMIFPIVSGSVNGLNNVDVNTLSYVYPNPAKDQVTLASSFNMEKVEIFNMLGQKVYENTLNGNATTVNVSDFNNGTYIVKIFTEAGLATKKIVVE
ncbi:MAG: hypothetical protein H6Q16_69 [Bacteroidetes bacterium]|nr:hypothetical protein [Bacteroidota bacterium]